MSQPRKISGWLVLGLWLLNCLIAYAVLGSWTSTAVEGVDVALLSKLPPIVGALALLACLVVTVLWARGSGGAAPARAASSLGRRRFLIGAAAGLGGILGSSGAFVARMWGWATVTGPYIGPEVPTSSAKLEEAWKSSRIQSYRRLGRTDARVSDIALGTGQINLENDGEAIARRAIERGVSYFDTAPDYSGNGSELAMGRAMKGYRDKMFLATKFCTKDGHLPPGSSVQQYMEAVEGSLGRLQTDYVDLVHIHSCDTVERLMDPPAHEAFDRLKQQGKVRFLGVSTHTPNLETVADAALESDRFDVMMLAYHHGAWPKLASIVDRAAHKDVGIVAMKTLKGAKHEGLLEVVDQGLSYPQAAFKWVLSNPSVSCLVVSFFEHKHVDEYLAASGQKPSAEELALLRRYDELIAGKYCFPHCGACLESCPERLPIHDVLRHRMYFEDYGNQKEAMRLYSRLEKQADVCIGCSAPCVASCPHGVPIQERTIGAHRMLTFS